MGKFVSYFAILVAIDLMFLVTGQLALNSNLSLIVGALIDPSNIDISSLFINIFIAGGLALVALGAAVLVGIVSRTENLIYVGIAITLANLLIGDFITIFNNLRAYNPVLAIMVMSPLMILFVIIMLEWARGKD